jgi:hypothetical protein
MCIAARRSLVTGWPNRIGDAVSPQKRYVPSSRNGFETLPLDRIYASAYANNPASVRVLEKTGFEFEGRMRRNVIKDGVVLDSLLYARIRD